MSSPWESGLRSEALDALSEIDELARDLLAPEKYDETVKVSMALLGSKEKRRWAHAKLVVEVGLKPSRPLLYLMPLLQSLPRCTRDCIRYLGDYIDLLTKELAFEYFKGNARHSSLGTNASLLAKSKIPEIQDLAKAIMRYNRFLYTPGKHDFSLPPRRHHRFTAREVVLTTYVTAVLAAKIKAISEAARIAVEKDNLYMIGGRWGSKKRVEYAYE
jgi:hypothetical protein